MSVVWNRSSKFCSPLRNSAVFLKETSRLFVVLNYSSLSKQVGDNQTFLGIQYETEQFQQICCCSFFSFSQFFLRVFLEFWSFSAFVFFCLKLLLRRENPLLRHTFFAIRVSRKISRCLAGVLLPVKSVSKVSFLFYIFEKVSFGEKSVLNNFYKVHQQGRHIGLHKREKRREVTFPITAGWAPNKQFCFSKWAPFRILTPHSKLWHHIAAKWSSNGGLEAVVSKWFAQGHKGLSSHRCSFHFCFSPPIPLFLSLTIPLS